MWCLMTISPTDMRCCPSWAREASDRCEGNKAGWEGVEYLTMIRIQHLSPPTPHTSHSNLTTSTLPLPQVLKCHDFRTNRMYAVKIIRNKKRFHHQALVELKVLKYLVEEDPDDSYNVVHMQV